MPFVCEKGERDKLRWRRKGERVRGGGVAPLWESVLQD